MPQERLEAHRVTKPIQLLAAWLVGLIIVDGSFLSAATLITKPSWAASLLVIAAVANVPLFLICIFVLQTRFRPEMQEDTYYSKYLVARQETRRPENTANDLSLLRAEIFESQKKTLEVIDKVQSQLVELTAEVKDLFREKGRSEKISQRINELERLIKQSKDSLVAVKKRADWGEYQIMVNNLLPTYKQIVTCLNANDIAISDTFGTTSNPPEVPPKFVFTFGTDIPPVKIQEVLRLCYDLGVDAISFAPYDLARRKIYIGSYAYKNSPRDVVGPLDGEFLKMLLRPMETFEEFRDVVLTHKQRTKE